MWRSQRASQARKVAFRSAAIGSAAFGALAGTTAAGLWYQIFRRPLPKTRGRVKVTGLSAQVEIRRDRWGVPHVHAATRPDLWFGQGFCHGQDRLWQLDLYRRMASGRLSEIVGGEALRADRLMRTLGLRRIAERELPELSPGLREELDAYCAGVNSAVEAARARSRARRAARPRLPDRAPRRDLARGRVCGGRPRSRRADRPGPRDPRPRRRGERLEQLGRLGRPLEDEPAAARGRSPPSPQHAGDLLRGRAGAERSLRARRVAPRRAGHLDGADQRRGVLVHE